jgi:hypothetical protein
MAAKLASRSSENKVWVSDRFFEKLTGDRALNSCGCGSGNGQKSSLWTKTDISDDERFDFDSAYVLTSNWCRTHGREYFRDVVRYDD